MSYKIIGDSCTDLTEALKKDNHISIVPLSLQVGNEVIVDDVSFNQKMFIKKMNESRECPKSSCPSPEAYMREFEGAEEVYVVTLSSKLSGSNNSAELAKKIYLENHPNKKIAVFDSESASIAQTLLVMKIKEFVEAGRSFSDVAAAVNKFRDSIKTKFVLESLENLRKNGRLNNLTAVICSALNIKPIMGSNEGMIIKLDQARGIERALMKLVKFVEEDVKDAKTRVLGISHCNNYERALFVKENIMKHIPFRDCFIAEQRGVSTLYANEGGIIIAY